MTTSSTPFSRPPSSGRATTSRKSQMGRFGEAVAVRYLTQRVGMTLLDRNWRCRHGEIDIVLRDGDVLVVCEVKARTSMRFGHPLEQISGAKVERLKVLAACWCEAHDVKPSDLRIDAVGVILDGRAEVVHARGIGW